ncbi:unnamed protein product [Calicophoron daubneyi]|uniref:AAA+ ATPase domain-containing protein n=1 Tax=Calicophoron daubneyi TaxID=300641 RepID=A0AAV2T2V3_CALDB
MRRSRSLGRLVSACCTGPKFRPYYSVQRQFTNRARSTTRGSFILDTRRSIPESNKTTLLRQLNRDEVIKNLPQATQLQLVEAYLNDCQSSRDKESKWQTLLAILKSVGKIAAVGALCYYLLPDMSNKVGKRKLSESNIVSFAEEVNITFDDVKGCDEVKNELRDIAQFLKSPEVFKRLGAKLPKGVLLVGPPGVGKTLLAKALSGEAKVPFLYASGSAFEDIYVGMGASRVRQLFTVAKQVAPCVIFIDEIDSVGHNRTSSPEHPYANQTINQLLAEMDGFQSSENIIVLGATNQVKDLDKALLRPGRFDVQIHVSPPTFEGRVALFQLYLSKVRVGPDVDVQKLAHGTVGYTGADIQNLVNQAAISAGLNNDVAVTMKHLWETRDRLMLGLARRRPLDERTNEISAYHEAGHALVALLTPGSIPLHQVSIIPRGDSGGYTSFLPDKDLSFHTRSQILAELDSLMGGRVGEELAFGPENITTGASHDFMQATLLAEKMVLHFGFSSNLGPRVVDPRESQLSPARRELIDKEVDKLLNDSLARTRTILASHSKEHKILAEALLHYESLTKQEVMDVLAGRMKIPKSHPTVRSSGCSTENSNPSLRTGQTNPPH